eukprot:Blabericola_migrator_1__3462@NODE_2021_length_3404_cov_112_009290_g1284_i0_p1_GENE_NODE_2021_length_3404_cov_112_009290_g1284_i0NODE_2021_length_3404_cov_112_009290_g1284_i0_p1_ORF_typecomplete_len585_score94_21RabGAPTBC/PF00566_18/4_2e07DDHD/PF02862_17/2_6e03DDHD/PF02862_17/0_41_NODE_2021_length_3404_cov_112_009290_g1284_i0321756
MSGYEECEDLETWSLRLLKRIDSLFFPKVRDEYEFANSPDVLGVRASLLATGIRMASVTSPKGSASHRAFRATTGDTSSTLTPAGYEQLLDHWFRVHESWDKVEDQARRPKGETPYHVCVNALAPGITQQELERQVLVDVNRSYTFFDIHLPPNRINYLQSRRELYALILQLFKDTNGAASRVCNETRHTCEAKRCDTQPREGCDTHQSNKQCDTQQSPTQQSNAHESVKQCDTRPNERPHTPAPTDGASGEELTPVEFRYLQGLHDVCCIVLELDQRRTHESSSDDCLVNDRVLKLCKYIVAHRIFPAHSSLSLLIATRQTLAQVAQLLNIFHPAFLADLIASRHEPIAARHWRGDGTELHGILPWMMTLFAHSLPRFHKVVAMWSILFAFPPAFLPYWLTAALMESASTSDLTTGTPFLCEANAPSFDPDLFQLVINATDYVVKWTPLQMSRRAQEELVLEQELESKWFDAADTYTFTLPPKSVLPPFWFPLLGHDTLAVKLDQAGLVRGVNTSAIRMCDKSLIRLEREWKLFRKSTSRNGQHKRHHFFSPKDILFLMTKPMMKVLGIDKEK